MWQSVPSLREFLPGKGDFGYRFKTAECFQCLDCQVEYFDDRRCPPLAAIRKIAHRGTGMRLNTLPAMSRAISGQNQARRGSLRIAAAAAIVPALAGGVRALAPRGKLYDCQLGHGGLVGDGVLA